MVFIKDEIKRLKRNLIENSTGIDVYLYNYINNIENNTDINIPTNSKELAICGYSKKKIDNKIIDEILLKPPVRGIDYKTNIYELMGIFLLNNKNINMEEDLIEKYQKSTLENKYLIYKIYPQILERLKKDVENVNDAKGLVIKNILDMNVELIESEIYLEFISKAENINDLIIMEDLYKKMIISDIQFHDQPKDIIINILKEFSNSIKRITLKRRKDHDKFIIKDEYDVQDLLYVILKSMFPKMLQEENTPQVGGKTERTDFMFKEFGIILEIKMIKESDKDEKEFVKQIKVDIESYYRENPKYIIFFIYDPQKKTINNNNFYDLQSIIKKEDETGKYEYEVITILSN